MCWKHALCPSYILIVHHNHLFKLILLHGFVPHDFGLGISVSLVKDKAGNINNIDNYRARTLSPVISKLFEVVLLSTRWGIISGLPVTFGHSSGNNCPNLMILSMLWTEKICIQAQSKICHHTLILLLHYLAETTGVYITTEALRF